MIKVQFNNVDMSLRSWSFPAGDQGIQILDNDSIAMHEVDEVLIEISLVSSDSIMQLLMLTDAWKGLMCNNVRSTLCINYVPYSQQDRVCNEGEALSARVMADLINTMEYDCVEIMDPHSPVMPALIHNSTIISQSDLLLWAPSSLSLAVQDGILIAPDAGAAKRTEDLAKEFDATVIYGRKRRDLATGDIIDIDIPGIEEHDVVGKTVVIVDDICLGGGTFVPHALSATAAGAERVILFVSHGVFSGGLERFEGIIDEIYCSDSFDKEVDTSGYTGVFKVISMSSDGVPHE